MRLMWLTDIHLNFLNSTQRDRYYTYLKSKNFDKVVITGDIGEANDYQTYLFEMGKALARPIYFVHGNHDFWRSSFTEVRKQSRILTSNKKTRLYWLRSVRPLRLTNNTALVGVDSFYDMRNGMPGRAGAVMRDFYAIQELARAHRVSFSKLKEACAKRADADVKTLKTKLESCVKMGVSKIIIATHVPPVSEVCYYRGNLTDALHLPFYSCQSLGDMLVEFAGTHADIDFLVLSGHTHGKAEFKYLSNLTFKVGGAEYDAPDIAEIFDVT